MADQGGAIKWDGLEGKFYWGRKIMAGQGFGDTKEQKIRILVSDLDMTYWNVKTLRKICVLVGTIVEPWCFECSIATGLLFQF